MKKHNDTKVAKYIRTCTGSTVIVRLYHHEWQDLFNGRRIVVNEVWKRIYNKNSLYLEPDDCYELAREWANDPKVFVAYIDTYLETGNLYEAMDYLNDAILCRVGVFDMDEEDE